MEKTQQFKHGGHKIVAMISKMLESSWNRILHSAINTWSTTLLNDWGNVSLVQSNIIKLQFNKL